MEGQRNIIHIVELVLFKPIGNVLAKVNIPDDPVAFSPLGRHIAKHN